MNENFYPSAPPPYSPTPAGMTYGFAPPQSNPYPLTSTDPPQQQYSNPVKPSPQPYSQPQHPVTHQPFTPSSQGPVNQTVVIIGGCPSCRVGSLEKSYSCCGLLCAIFCFPCGILCCLCMKEKKCTNCGATF